MISSRGIEASLLRARGITSYPLGMSLIFSPRDLFSVGDIGWLHDSSMPSLFTDAAGTIPVTAVDDYIGKQNDLSGNGYHATQSTSTARPQYKGTYIKFDLTDDKLTKTAPAIASGTIVIFTNKGAWFDTFSCSAGTFDHGPTTYTGGPTGLFTALRQGANDYREIGRLVINRALTAAEKANLLAWAKSRGCPGEITLSSINVNGGFDTDTGWTKGAGWSISGGVASRTAQAVPSAIDSTVVGQAGKVYYAKSHVTLTAGSIQLTIAGTFTGVNLSAGMNKNIVIASSSSPLLNFYCTNTFAGSLDNITVDEIIFP